MTVCPECGQRQDDPQYSYHEAWCSETEQLVVLTVEQVNAAEADADQPAADLGWPPWPNGLTV